MFQKTTAQRKILSLKKRVRIIQGGTSASKTFSIIPFLIQYARDNANSEISIVSETIPHLKRGAVRDFIKIMRWTGNWQDENFNKSALLYTFHSNSYIEFFSADQPEKLKGARRDVLFINEANNVPFEAYQQLSIRTKKFIYLDFNPTHEFWVHTELMQDKDTDFLILTYKDNEALDKTIVKEIEKAKEKAKTSTYWDNWWRVYGLGEIGRLEGVCIPDWKQLNIMPKDEEGNDEARILCYGLDFGYSNDFTALVGLYKWNNAYIFDEVLYKKGMLNSEISNFLKDQNIKETIYADSAEPKSIAELKSYGHNVIPVTKGKDSIMYGINLINQNEIYITSRSTNLIKELRTYIFDTDKDGNRLNKPVGMNDHAIDSARYALMMQLVFVCSFFL